MNILQEKLEKKLGKTADKNGKYNQEHLNTAQIQTEISKVLMIAKNKMQRK